MDGFKKEKSSKQHMKISIDHHSNAGGNDLGNDGLLLANPMACQADSPGKHISSPKNDVHFSLHNSTSPSALPEAQHPNTVVSHSRTNSDLEYSGNSQSGTLSRATSSNSDRSSFRDKQTKSRPKSPSLFRFFVKGHSTGSANGSLTNSPMTGTNGRRSVKRSVAVEDEEDYGGDASSNNSDHEDPFSPRGMSAAGDLIPNRHATESPKSTGSVEQTGTLPRQLKRHMRSSSSGSGNYTCRDSGFSSERESVSQMREDREIFEDARCSMSPGPLEEEYRGGGMEALESLHNQLQILVKQNSSSEESDAVAVYEEVIASLSRQLEDLSTTVACLRETDHTLRLGLRLAEQKVLEAEAKVHASQERCQRVETRNQKLSRKYQTATKKLKELEKYQQKGHLQRSVSNNPSPRNSKVGPSPKRVHSQNQYDRKPRPDSAPSIDSRPSTAQDFNQDQPSRKISSLSHTETCV